jgi:hypothetical protein
VRLRVICTSPISEICRLSTAALSRAHCLLQRVEDLPAVRELLHVDEVDHDDAADVPQAELVHDLLRGFEVRPQDRLSWSFLPTYRPVLTSIVVSDSVWSITR